MTTKNNLAIPTNAGMARFVRYAGGFRPGDDSHRLIWEAVCSCLALRSSCSLSLPEGSLVASSFVASDCSCHFCSVVFLLLMMQSLASGGSATLSSPGRCRDGPVMGIVFHARAPTYWSIQITSRKRSVRSSWSILLTSPNFLISLCDEFNLRSERYTAPHVVAAHE
jgi:hypothetical protein